MSATTDTNTASVATKQSKQNALQLILDAAPWMSSDDAKRFLTECHNDPSVAVNRILDDNVPKWESVPPKEKKTKKDTPKEHKGPRPDRKPKPRHDSSAAPAADSPTGAKEHNGTSRGSPIPRRGGRGSGRGGRGGGAPRENGSGPGHVDGSGSSPSTATRGSSARGRRGRGRGGASGASPKTDHKSFQPVEPAAGSPAAPAAGAHAAPSHAPVAHTTPPVSRPVMNGKPFAAVVAASVAASSQASHAPAAESAPAAEKAHPAAYKPPTTAAAAAAAAPAATPAPPVAKASPPAAAASAAATPAAAAAGSQWKPKAAPQAQTQSAAGSVQASSPAQPAAAQAAPVKAAPAAPAVPAQRVILPGSQAADDEFVFGNVGAPVAAAKPATAASHSTAPASSAAAIAQDAAAAQLRHSNETSPSAEHAPAASSSSEGELEQLQQTQPPNMPYAFVPQYLMGMSSYGVPESYDAAAFAAQFVRGATTPPADKFGAAQGTAQTASADGNAAASGHAQFPGGQFPGPYPYPFYPYSFPPGYHPGYYAAAQRFMPKQYPGNASAQGAAFGAEESEYKAFPYQAPFYTAPGEKATSPGAQHAHSNGGIKQFASPPHAEAAGSYKASDYGRGGREAPGAAYYHPSFQGQHSSQQQGYSQRGGGGQQ